MTPLQRHFQFADRIALGLVIGLAAVVAAAMLGAFDPLFEPNGLCIDLKP